jgi:hypothetical protein
MTDVTEMQDRISEALGFDVDEADVEACLEAGFDFDECVEELAATTDRRSYPLEAEDEILGVY